MCDAAAQEADVTAIVPTPWVPPLMPLPAISRFRRIPHRERRGRVSIHFPRVPGSIEYHTHRIDARLSLPIVSRLARRLHQESPFDLIHAHFIYPDGVVASHLGRLLGVPVMTSEHAFWTPWLLDQPTVGAQVSAALPGIQLVTTVSDFLRRDVAGYLHGRADVDVLPNVVDDLVFTPAPRPRDPDQLLYVGLIRKFKRVDVLLRAVAEARRTLPQLHLRLLSANAYRAYGADRRQMRTLIAALGLESAVQVENGADPPAVAEAMRRCAFVVVSSSRRETFCSVAAEALACGTPLVLTRCGGPEEFVTPRDGVTVPADDPGALAEGIILARARRDTFVPEGLRSRIIDRFGRAAWTRRAMAIYERVAARGAGRARRERDSPALAEKDR
jgi:glycosyltransferase involved in cell wall biosynthesis